MGPASRLFVRTVALGAVLTLIPLVSRAGDALPSPAPTLPPVSPYVSIEDEAAPEYFGEPTSSNVVNFRAQLPIDADAWVLRMKFPRVTAAPEDSVTGSGDLALFGLANVGAANGGSWLIGGTARLPTADDTLGTHKYSLGPAFGLVTKAGAVAVGFFQQDFFSIIGPKAYNPVAKSQIAPVLRFGFGSDWRIGLSTMQFTYDWVLNKWTDVPLGVRVEKKQLWQQPLSAYVEIERNLAHTPDTPGWTLRSSLRWTFGKKPQPLDTDDGDSR